ncbi:MAG: leucine-rich repeat domain-containing protein [Deltaproteobacteria bacterium]|nr:leucine-rich repeat domain-containing protein [Deltaproteobacteria bacterium]
MSIPIGCHGLVRGARWSLFVLVLASGAARAAIPASERQALLDLYTSTNGAGWALSTNWNGVVGTECTWFGVTCDGAQTTVLDTTLNFNNLVGPLPATIGNLVGLQTLDLAFNQLSGTIPSFATNTALSSLDLHNNQLSGTIPSFAANTALSALELSDNQLTGTIPSFAANPALEFLYLNSNPLSGTIPSFAANTALRVLVLYSNQLSGTIPSFATNTALQILHLSSNQLTGAIPSFAANTALRNLYLHDNQLSGAIPSFAANTALQVLYLQKNQLSGTVPSFGANTALVYLSLDSNQLIGSVDPSLGTLTNLNAGNGLDLRWNALSSTNASLIAFLNSKQSGGDWQGTQTIPVTGLSVSGITGSQVTVNWAPITYTADPGNYQVFTSTVSGGPYTPFATVTVDKSATSLAVTGLAPLTPYYFVVQTTTAPHALNQNTVLSGDSAEVSTATTPVELMSFQVE